MYEYDVTGNMKLAVQARTSGSNRHAVRLVNDPHGRPWLAMHWGWEEEDGEIVPDSPTLVAVKEYRYDSGRGRYLVRERCPDEGGCDGGIGYMEVLDETWTDYDGEQYYADWEVDQGSPVEVMGYLPGAWQMAAGSEPEYYHGDQIGTTRMMTDTSTPHPQITRQAVYTAFGELIWTADGSTETRYGYAGTHGYEERLLPQSGSPWGFPFMHVGARWYDPVTGRFLQRDPIGTAGGLNVYTYVLNMPSALVDPSGLLYCPACEANVYRKNPPPAPKKEAKRAPTCKPAPPPKSTQEESNELNQMHGRMEGEMLIAAAICTGTFPPGAIALGVLVGAMHIYRHWPVN